MGGGPWIKGIKGCGLAMGRKRGPILGFSLKLLWGEMPCWDGISLKKVNMSWDHLIHAMEVGE